jgi:crossover junction endodeoxyribonuclease RuvC
MRKNIDCIREADCQGAPLTASPSPVLGIDFSLTGCGVAISNGTMLTEFDVRSKPTTKDVAAMLARFRKLCAPIVEAAALHRPRLVVIEGLSFGSKGGAAFDRAGARWMLLDRLEPHVGMIVECAPSTLKKFACGRGNGDKTAVVSALANRYGRSFNSDDAADAFALAQLGLCLVGSQEPANAAQREAVATVRKGMP